MPSKRPATVFRRGATWAMRRAVPKAFHGVEPRRIITRSLSATTQAAAEREAAIFWRSLVRDWSNALPGQGTTFFEEKAAAKRRAARQGLDWLPASQVARLPSPKLFHRLGLVQAVEGRYDPEEVRAYLGAISVPPLTPWTLFEGFCRHLDIHDATRRSPDQKRRLIANHRRAVAVFVESVGNVDLKHIAIDQLVGFHGALLDRLPDRSVNTANAQVFRMERVIVLGARMLGVPPPVSLRDYRFRAVEHRPRPAFSREWITQRLLAPGALAGLDSEARGVLLGMVNTGYRLSEGANLQVEDIRLDTKIPHLTICGHERSLKTRHSVRCIPLAGISLQAFRDCPTGFARYRDKPSLSNRLNAFLTARGLRETPAHSVYSLRHAFEQRLIAAGVDRRLQTELMGHSDGRPAYARPLPLEMLVAPIAAISLG